MCEYNMNGEICNFFPVAEIGLECYFAFKSGVNSKFFEHDSASILGILPNLKVPHLLY